MNKATVKNRIINRINKIDDEVFLKELEDLITHLQAANEQQYPLSDAIKKSIKKSETDLENGYILTHEEVMKKAKEWLKEK